MKLANSNESWKNKIFLNVTEEVEKSGHIIKMLLTNDMFIEKWPKMIK